MTLKELRAQKGLTQKQCAFVVGIPLRTYIRYEQNSSLQGTLKYNFILSCLEKFGTIDETHGVLSVEEIRNTCQTILPDYNVEFCYLFGSYAKGTATEKSDVDLLVCTDVSGLRFFEMVEKLKQSLKKDVDVLNQKQLKENVALTNEILKYGVKIYG